MRGWLIDTNVLSEARRPRPDERVIAFMSRHESGSYFVSTVTFAELRYGIERLDDLEHRAGLRLWLDHVLRPQFASTTLDVSEEVILRWRLLLQAGRRAGMAFPPPDLLIAATALVHGMTVVTRDVRHFAATGAPVLNPWLPDLS